MGSQRRAGAWTPRSDPEARAIARRKEFVMGVASFPRPLSGLYRDEDGEEHRVLVRGFVAREDGPRDEVRLVVTYVDGTMGLVPGSMVILDERPGALFSSRVTDRDIRGAGQLR
jgi:hypothetical protein